MYDRRSFSFTLKICSSAVVEPGTYVARYFILLFPFFLVPLPPKVMAAFDSFQVQP